MGRQSIAAFFTISSNSLLYPFAICLPMTGKGVGKAAEEARGFEEGWTIQGQSGRDSEWSSNASNTKATKWGHSSNGVRNELC